MQFIINTEKDLQKIQGKFVLQLDSDEPDKTLMDFHWGFVKEKRLKFVCGLRFTDLCGYVLEMETFEEFKNVFNSYLFDYMVKAGKTDGGRFHRLLTSKELDYLLTKIKEENY